MNRAILLWLLLVTTTILAVTVTPHETPKKWNDTTRVAIIWNDGTGNEELSDDWKYDVEVGDLGHNTKTFVSNALYHLKSSNIKEYYGMMSEWEELTLDSIRSDFGNRFPHVIIYINAGYEWGQEFSWGAKPKTPYDIITNATKEGIGIVAIGDDAAYDAKKIFPLTGPGGSGEPIQYDNKPPYMAGAVDYPPYHIDELTIVIENSDPVVDAGLLWKVPTGDLRFKEYKKDGRGQSDADIWDVDTSQLDDYFIVGFQRAKVNEEQWYAGGISSFYVGNTPSNIIIPSANTYKNKASYSYNALAGLQDGNHRIVMVGYQPQYLENENLSSQIIYNAVYWSSKAHELLQINTPEADPNGGKVQTIDKVSLSVTYPKNSDLYDIYYTLDGSTPTKSSAKYDSPLELGTKSESVTLKAIAFSKDDAWIDSEMLTVEYLYEGGPVVDSAYFQPAPIIDFATSKRGDDTLTVFFNMDVEKISSSTPFEFKDRDDNDYNMKLNHVSTNSNKVVFTVTDFHNKSSMYIPENGKDSLIVNPKKNITSTNGIVQDGTNNSYGPIYLLPPSKNIEIRASWLDSTNSDKGINEIFHSIGIDEVPYSEGVLITVDPKTPLTKELYENFKISFKVLDAVGNTLTESENRHCFFVTKEIQGRPQLFATWNGTNQKDRNVSGTVILLLEFRDHENERFFRSIPLSLPVR